MDLQGISINQQATIVEALRKLNEIRDVSRLILFVTDTENRVIGSLTDGDIRRSLARDMDIHKKIDGVCNRNFVFERAEKQYVDLSFYRKKNIKILPLLDKKDRLEGIIDLGRIRSVLPLECVLMAGGRGKRLSPLTDNTPKPMLPLGEKPIIEHNIDRLISFGIQKIYIAINYLGDQIESYFGDGSSKGIKIEYIREKKALGTAGALSLVTDFQSDHILLMNSDLFTDVDFEDMYRNLLEKDADIMVASTEYKVDIPYAIFETRDESVVGFREKPTYVYYSNAGIYMIKKELIQQIPENTFYDITDLMDEVNRKGGTLAHNPIIGYWVDIGKPTDYEQAQEFIKHLK
ncbi:nucleotidyltransferase family protein [Robiginitalea sp. IMCC43444]|uniref:nucleotidyltransferase family protein n=1 Tax=Robiginitalea sp. IMCC43444 TaxID=3459121 RepID=UPI0040437262